MVNDCIIDSPCYGQILVEKFLDVVIALFINEWMSKCGIVMSKYGIVINYCNKW